jgi:hypothetical protein
MDLSCQDSLRRTQSLQNQEHVIVVNHAYADKIGSMII